MKIQYKLVKVARDTYYSELRNSNASYDFSTEIEYVQKDSEKEVEEWLESAFVAVAIVKDAEYRYIRADNRWTKATPTEVVELYEVHKELLEKYRADFGYDLIDDSCEYRIVKIYTKG